MSDEPTGSADGSLDELDELLGVQAERLLKRANEIKRLLTADLDMSADLISLLKGEAARNLQAAAELERLRSPSART